MSQDLDRFANAVDHERHYFSNGTEGSIWMAQYCNRCNNDHAFHKDQGDGCELALAMVMGWDVPELEELPDPRRPGLSTLHCLAFAPCPCNGGGGDPGPPRPRPELPGQERLFDADTVPPGIIWRTDPAEFMCETPVEVQHV